MVWSNQDFANDNSFEDKINRLASTYHNLTGALKAMDGEIKVRIASELMTNNSPLPNYDLPNFRKLI